MSVTANGSRCSACPSPITARAPERIATIATRNRTAAGDYFVLSACLSGSIVIRIILPRCQPSAAPMTSAIAQNSQARPFGGYITAM